ncbi:MAG: M28 family metallopeptidase [Promethearchaeota archaeon]|jgi:hypothetical protein
MIDTNRIRANLELFSVPRLSGTESERKSFVTLKNKIEDFGITPTIQKFVFTSFYSRAYPKISLFLLNFILFTIIFDFYFGVLSIIVFIALLSLILITRNPERNRIGKKLPSQNLYVKLNSKDEIKISQINSENNGLDPSSQNIFLFSHLDSKGQRFSIWARVTSVWVWILSYSSVIITKTFHLVLFDSPQAFITLIEICLFLINFAATFFIILNSTNNKSFGAIDNLSGVSCVLELLNFFSKPENRLTNFKLWFVFTGAEETGTMGVRVFYHLIKDLDRKKNFTINFDSICNRMIVFNSSLINYSTPETLKLISRRQDIFSLVQSKSVYPGIHSDGLFLLKKNFAGLGFGDNTANKYIHTAEDTVEKINIEVLADLCHLMTVVLNEVDNKYNKK